MTKITYCKEDFLSARLKRVNDIIASMKRLKEKSIYWQRPFGWRTGTYYIPRQYPELCVKAESGILNWQSVHNPNYQEDTNGSHREAY